MSQRWIVVGSQLNEFHFFAQRVDDALKSLRIPLLVAGWVARVHCATLDDDATARPGARRSLILGQREVRSNRNRTGDPSLCAHFRDDVLRRRLAAIRAVEWRVFDSCELAAPNSHKALTDRDSRAIWIVALPERANIGRI